MVDEPTEIFDDLYLGLRAGGAMRKKRRGEPLTTEEQAGPGRRQMISSHAIDPHPDIVLEVLSLGPRGDPVVRIRRLGPLLSQRRLRFLARSSSTRLLVDQLRDFPVGAHDDGPDALEMALRLAEDVLQGRSSDDGLGARLPVG